MIIINLVTLFKINFFNVDYFLSLYRICHNITSVLGFRFFGHEAGGILVSQPGIKSAPPTLEGKVLIAGP